MLMVRGRSQGRSKSDAQTKEALSISPPTINNDQRRQRIYMTEATLFRSLGLAERYSLTRYDPSSLTPSSAPSL
jgi:hypothetical protein